MAAVLKLCSLLLCLALLHASAYGIRPLAEAALLPSSQSGRRELLSLISEYKFDSEVDKVIASSSSTRRSLKKKLSSGVPPAASPTVTPPPPSAAGVPPPPKAAHSDFVYEGY
eukprot:TRINITY_DN2569_c0_g1_i1.p2 TRINITY_DN2569_c0_g1~~TRINITY_DN2569_c0_g1_i1.p2  ORF type:complete len:113 (+),score=3.50 TRINITY_DN2569_c0_g1_i1:265-603(+)